MESKLPKNWVETELGVISQVITGNTPSKKHSEYYNGDIPWIKPGDIRTGIELFNSVETLTEEGAKNARLLSKGAVMVTCIGNLGNVAIAGTQMATNQQINSVIFNKYIDDKYGYYACNLLKPWLIENSTSTTISMVNKSVFSKAPFPLPPLAEQQRIVAKLDTLFGSLDALKIRLNNIPQLIKKFKQAVLTQAVTGKLIRENIEFKTLEYFKIGIKTGPFGTALHKSDYVKNGIPVINPSHIKNGTIIPDLTITVDSNKAKELSRWILKKDDIILGRRGEMGRASKYENTKGSMICGTGSLVLKVSEKISTDFLTYYLRSPFCVNYLESNSVGTTMINLNQKILKSLPFPLLTIEEQEFSIEKIQGLFSKADAIEKQYKTLKEKIDRLPQAILAKAFKGELVAQLPTDGDAKDLLEEIKKLKESLVVKPKKKVVRKKK